jgi:hypothetical protein
MRRYPAPLIAPSSISTERAMLYLHCTKKLLNRLKCEVITSGTSTTSLGNWYATALLWKPQIALFVNERTLLPVLMPLAPVSSLAARFPRFLAQVLAAHGIQPPFIEQELLNMQEVRYAKTTNRSVVGIMMQFSHFAEGYRGSDKMNDLVELSLKMARMPCSPLYKGPVFPDKALRELVGSSGGV